MSTTIDLEIHAELERTEGKFASRDELVEMLIEDYIEEPSDLEAGEGGRYEVTVWDVTEAAPKRRGLTDEEKLIRAIERAASFKTGPERDRVAKIVKLTADYREAHPRK